MMKKTHYLKDTERFWKKRTKARASLDRERANASFSKKIEITEKLRKDALFIKTGKEVSVKP